MNVGDIVTVTPLDGTEPFALRLEDRVFPDRTCGQYEAGFWAFRPGDEENADAPEYFVSLDNGVVWSQPQNVEMGAISMTPKGV
jgi:hypothetical protein